MRRPSSAARFAVVLSASLAAGCARGLIEDTQGVGWSADGSTADEALDVAVSREDASADVLQAGANESGADAAGEASTLPESGADSPIDLPDAPVCTTAGTSCGVNHVCAAGACQPCGDTGQYCCPAGACNTAPAQCIGVASPSACAATLGPQCVCGKLVQVQELTSGQKMVSCDARFSLVMQTDGNLVLYEAGVTAALWASNTAGSAGALAVMQDDGNFVVYTAAGTPVWSSNTAGVGCGAWLAVQTDGNVVIYDSTGKARWSTGTCCH